MMEIWIKPLLESLADEDDCLDENDEDALAFEQGFESWTEEVEPGETFEIPEGHQGVVDGHIVLDGDPDFSGTLGSGMYRLSEDGTHLKKVRNHL
jgi:hypothetical protein